MKNRHYLTWLVLFLQGKRKDRIAESEETPAVDYITNGDNEDGLFN